MSQHEYGMSADDGFTIYGANGRRVLGIGDEPTDLIAEWTDGPVRTETVTKRRIVPGVYGRLKVSVGPHNRSIAVAICGPRLDDEVISWSLTAEELDSLAMVASQLAEALRDVG